MLRRTVKFSLSTLAFLFLMTVFLRAEPKQYSGTLAGKPATAMLNWLDEKNVTGVFALVEAPDRHLILAGRNTGPGKLKVTLSEGVTPVGTVTLSKVTSSASIIWSGTVNFTDGKSGILELQRPL